MQLEKIEMTGFKSFADKTTIEFDKGVTAVVGPNGSGKSNLSEAIKWVLGEQSAKSLRGKKMDDVIFAGSQTRKPVNIAEVQLTIDNSDGALAHESQQVVLTRRLNRNGDSDFLINKKACRLKDITNLMLDSGLGKDSFALISQGKVEQIFNNKPEDRRSIVEEAAGVLKYKDRKHQAARKLEQTQDHLNRVQDILHEISSQLGPLQAQRDKAIEYLAKKEQLAQIEIALLAVEIETLHLQWQEALKQVQTEKDHLQDQDQKVAALQAAIDQDQVTDLALKKDLDQAQANYVQAVQALEQLQGQKNLLSQEAAFSQQSDQERQASLSRLIQEAEELKQSLAQAQADLVQRQVQLKQVQEEKVQLTAELDSLASANSSDEKDLQAQYIQALQDQSRLSNQVKSAEKQMDQNQSAQDRLTSKLESLDQSLQDLTKDLKEVQSKQGEAQDQVDRLAHDLDQQKREGEGLAVKAKDLEEKTRQVQAAFHKTQATLQSLQQVSEDYGGYFQGVKAVLTHKDQIPGVIGAVAEVIDVPDYLTTAIEIALGGAAQHILVEDEKAARAGIQYLKDQKQGRATFLPLTIIKGKTLAGSLLASLAKVKGFLGLASDLVSCDPAYEAIKQNLLGTTLVTQDLLTAQALAKEVQHRYRIVSLEGDIVHAGGSMTGGASRNQANQSLLKRKTQIQALEGELEKLDQALRQVQVQDQEARDSLALARQTYQDTNQAYHESQALLSQYQQKASYLQDQMRQQDRLRQAQDFELEELIQEFQELESDYIQNHQSLTQITAKAKEVKLLLDQAQVSDQDRAKLLQEKQVAFQAISSQEVRLQEQVAQVKREIKASQKALTENSSDQALLDNKVQALHQAQVQADIALDQVVQALEAKGRELQEAQEQVSRLKAEESQLAAKIKSNQVEVNFLQGQVQAGYRDLAKLETKASRYEITIDQKLTYLSEEYELTFEAALAKSQLTLSIEEAGQEVRKLKQAIDRIGPVNLLAIEEAQAIQERFDFLSHQQEDLVQAKETLNQTIAEMDKEVTTRFQTTFTAINRQFQKTFPRLFGGGRAALELTDPQDLLETGIEIIAQPPGKKLQSLSLLSGGERAFTAIALLFAILEVKPVPFCLLDEVEAALDEANVARYGRYLKEFTQSTQFIVITHRRGTMEQADVLYGVTMQESGVSKLASVKFDDYDQS